MSSKQISILAVAVLAMAAFVGVIAVGEDTDADTTGYSVSYIVDGRTYTVPQEDGTGVTAGTVSLATLASLGATAPEDKTFVAWNTAQDGTGTAYAAGSTLILDSVSKTATLYAIFTWTTYTATFTDADGKVIKTVTGTAEAPVSLSVDAPTAPAVEGKIFAGWLSEGADKALKNSELGALSENITYKATYVVDFKVTFIDGDKTYISKISDLTVPDLGTRTGYTFLGWYIGTEQITDPTAYDFAEDTTFTAKWEPMNVFVTFTAGSFSTTVTVLYGQTVVEPAIPSGFTKWDFDFTTPITEDITVMAIAEEEQKTGLDDPITMTLAILVGLLAILVLAVFVWALRNGKIVIGKGPNAKKNEKAEDVPKGPDGGQQ